MGLEMADHLVQVGVDAMLLIIMVGSWFGMMAFPGSVASW